ncbi:MAG: type II secretion system protein GspG [Verrucomicrobiae bacterium]|nr:type II secretion system protein GspG [Verrucomicrobiae bacterium]MDW8344750.1 type II secretion system protein GspG [Verrucomicrobiae bacterium]
MNPPVVNKASHGRSCRPPYPTGRTGAFTLIELMAVITIIAVLAGLVLSIAAFANRKAAVSRAQAEIAELSRAIEAYRLDFGQYPTSSTIRATNLLNNALLHQQLVSRPGRYITFRPHQLRVSGTTTNILDPFGNPYNYFRVYVASSDVATNRTTFDLWSFGPDGQSNTVDDITNWR